MNENIGIATHSADSPSRMQVGYFFFRIMLGINLFFHGFMRVLSGLSEWEAQLSLSFVDTFLPMPLVHIALFAIPIVEIIVGGLLIVGLFTSWALIGSVSLMVVLLFGHATRQTWPQTHIVMPWGIYFWVMLVLENHNWLALDNLRTLK